MKSSTMDSKSGWATLQESQPSGAVVSAVAAAAGVDETELPPLFHTIDPDALDSLFDSGHGGALDAQPEGVVSFRYYGFDVQVSSDGTVDVERAAGT